MTEGFESNWGKLKNYLAFGWSYDGIQRDAASIYLETAVQTWIFPILLKTLTEKLICTRHSDLNSTSRQALNLDTPMSFTFLVLLFHPSLLRFSIRFDDYWQGYF